MVAHSSEFENIVVRDEEQNELEQMIRTSCPLEVKGGPTNKHGKVSILIQVFTVLVLPQILFTFIVKGKVIYDNSVSAM